MTLNIKPAVLSELSGTAIDFGGSKIAVARYQQGELLQHLQIPTQPDASVTQQIETLITLLQQVGLQPDDALGVAVSGRVDQHGNWYAVNSQTLSQIENVPLRDTLIARLGQSVTVLNDVVAASLAEARYGAGMDKARFAYITVSTGVGGICCVGGLPLTSPDGLAGHAGFMTSRYATERCGSGRMATVESVASGHAIARASETAGYPNLTAQQVFSCHYRGEVWATTIVQRSAMAIAELSANLATLLGIEAVVLGGSIGLAADYAEWVSTELQEEPELFRVAIERAKLGQESVLLGALSAAHNDEDNQWI